MNPLRRMEPVFMWPVHHAPHLAKLDVYDVACNWSSVCVCALFVYMCVTSRAETIFRAVRGGRAHREKREKRAEVWCTMINQDRLSVAGGQKSMPANTNTNTHTCTQTPTYTRNTFQNKNSVHLKKKKKYTHKPKQRAADEAYVDIRTADQCTG